MDSGWDGEASGSNATILTNGSLSGMMNSNSGTSSATRSRVDWKWPVKDSIGSSILLSTDLSQVDIFEENVLHWDFAVS